MRRWFGVIPNLRARHFLGLRSYVSTLVLFLLLTFAAYLLVCLLSPSLISGWLRVTEGKENTGFAETIRSVPYPLFIAAAFMGLANPAIPGFSKVANLMRDIFHDLVGVPRLVANTATDFSVELWNKLSTSDARLAQLEEWTKLDWQNKIRDYADIAFYQTELSRRADELNKSNLSTSSEKEIKALLEQIIYVLSIAAVRKGGGAALRGLAKDLGVREPRSKNVPVRGLVAGALLSIVALTILWFAIPLAAPIVDRLNGEQRLDFWPDGQDALKTSGIYLLAQAIPILLAATILIISLSPNSNTEDDKLTLRGIVEKYSLTLLTITGVVFFFDYAQVISDYGINSPAPPESPVRFFASWIPFNALHSVISLVLCVVLLNYIVRGEIRTPGVSFFYLVIVSTAAVIFSFLYAVARLRFDFGKPLAIDYIIIICLLNTVAAAISLYLSQCICHRRLMKSVQPENTAPPPKTAAAP